jgi:hypothetical protein
LFALKVIEPIPQGREEPLRFTARQSGKLTEGCDNHKVDALIELRCRVLARLIQARVLCSALFDTDFRRGSDAVSGRRMIRESFDNCSLRLGRPAPALLAVSTDPLLNWGTLPQLIPTSF